MNPEVKQAEPLENYKLRIIIANDEAKEFDVISFPDKDVFTICSSIITPV